MHNGVHRLWSLGKINKGTGQSLNPGLEFRARRDGRGSVDWQLPAGLPPRGSSDPWAAGWPGGGRCSRIGLSRSHLPLNERRAVVSVKRTCGVGCTSLRGHMKDGHLWTAAESQSATRCSWWPAAEETFPCSQGN